MNSYLPSVIKQFEHYKNLGDQTFSALSFEELQWQANEDSNSVTSIAKHIVGNMLSRWTHFLTTDGEKDWRQRDLEFIDTFTTEEDLIAAWETGWNCLFNAMSSIDENDLERDIYIRNERHTVNEAINRQLAHYAYHIGQIVFLGKLLKGNDWTSLSIPKGQSEAYNEEKSAKE